MYSKQEARQMKQEFWTKFGQYMRPVHSAEGEAINWINYKTGEPHLNFRMDADNKSALIGIVLSHPDAGIRELYFEQLSTLKPMLERATVEEWDWVAGEMNEQGRVMSYVQKELEDVSIFRQKEWPALISFFKQRIIALDRFWAEAKYAFEALR